MYDIPDLTAHHPDHTVLNDPYTLYATGQKIHFATPIHYATLSITTATSPSVQLVEGVDYTYDADDVDTTSISRCKNYDPLFDKVIVTGITILKTITTPLRITMVYQQVYPVVSRVIAPDGAVELTPELIRTMLSRLADLEASIHPIEDTLAITDHIPRLLEEDPHAEHDSNIITERHTINTYQGQNIIRPQQGSFFKGTVQIRVPEQGYTMDPMDFRVFGVDHARTQFTRHDQGVYQFIQVLYAYAGEVEVTYHAYGGDVTIEDATAIQNNVQNLTAYLSGRSFVTPNTLLNTGAIQTIMNRVTRLEDRMRSLLPSGSPTYADGTYNTAEVLTLTAPDTDYHWYTIARLYTVDGSPEVVIADRAKFRIHLLGAQLLMDLSVGVDLRQSRTPFTIVTHHVSQDRGYTIMDSVSPTIGNTAIPKMRIVYDENLTSGIYLQIGLKIITMTETLGIEDLSGIESCWIIEKQGVNPLTPKDDVFALPDGSTVWDTSVLTSKSISRMIPSVHPYLAWHGVAPANTLDASYTIEVGSGGLLPATFDIYSIQKIRCTFVDTDNTYVMAEIPVYRTVSNRMFGQTVFYMGSDQLAVVTEIDVDVNHYPTITVNLEANSSTHSMYYVEVVT